MNASDSQYDKQSACLQRLVRPVLPIGFKTKRGKVVGVTNTGGERFYFLACPGGVTALMPADLVELPNDKLTHGATP